ncbi:MFS transporter [Sinomicrobium weinanense]|uniref:MFS transporter n=1 Tax=Sinomicrobium weinanense TaxID=2842200 RepID=A0A926JV26_9FLAO|nr:MFS transporter [Sinomicrobium weinanense]MBC9797706.1 MFS transporter [Sinomicrobium weinanense]MBU3122268.1 MFS transporter [Sinomicrobium weinanense]
MNRLFRTLNKTALVKAAIAAVLVVIMVLIGSRNLQYFDPALIAYLIGTVFAVFGIAYRYSVWIQRPPTRLYWRRSMQFLFSRHFIPYFLRSIRLFFRNIMFQRFLAYRGRTRWIGHFLLATGCVLAFAITIPLTFGWIHFILKPGDDITYYTYVFGFEAGSFALGSTLAFIAFHGLVWCSVLVTAGVVIMMKRRLTNGGLIATQGFENDWLPLILLMAISLTGLGISYDYTFLGGKTYQFMAVTHAITVILFLVWLPFGKFFHIFQRLAQLGANLYKKEGSRRGMAVCPHTKKAFASQTHVDDLKKITRELDFDFSKEDGTSHLDLSPEGKRSALARAHFRARQESGHFFG